MDKEDLNAKEWPLDAAHLQTQVTIEIDVLEVLLNNSKLNI